MTDLKSEITTLETRLDLLVRTQIDFQKEISAIRAELRRLSDESEPVRPVTHEPQVDEAIHDTEPAKYQDSQPIQPAAVPTVQTISPGIGGEPQLGGYNPQPTDTEPAVVFFAKYTESARENLEKFIGENLISKIGILILLIGVAIGVKYSIDKGLISPLARIVIAYLFAFGLSGLAIKLKKKYHNFSAALMSGGIAMMYFITYYAYSSYGLIGQLPAFGLMVIFTLITVAAAIFYNRQVIAHIGLVGAYAVPFLLSNGSGDHVTLFSYMAIINVGILIVSALKYWKPIFYTASAFTWLIFAGWYASRYHHTENFDQLLVFLAIFSAIFLASTVANELLHRESAKTENLVCALSTSLVFFLFCFNTIDDTLSPQDTWTFFTYLAVCTAGLLFLSFRLFGKAFLYVAIPAVWLIYADWCFDHYRQEQHFTTALFFTALFFAMFYASILIHKFFVNGLSFIEDAGLILGNSFMAYGFGYSILNSSETTANYLGLYTLGNSVFHFTAAVFIERLRPKATEVIHVLTVLILTFLTIAIPVQIKGSVLTMTWAVEAALLFWIARTKGIRLFEYFSFPVMGLAIVSLLVNWQGVYSDRAYHARDLARQVFFNGEFVTSLVFIAAFAFIYVVNRDHENETVLDKHPAKIFEYTVAGIILFAVYNTFRMEIGNYFHLLEVAAFESGNTTGVLEWRNAVWQIDYTMFFLTILAAVNLSKIRSSILAFANSGLALFTLLFFATAGMFFLYDLRFGDDAKFSLGSISFRYLSYAFAAGLLYALYQYKNSSLFTEQLAAGVLSYAFEAVLFSFWFVVASCEMIILMEQLHIPDAMKFGLSILWGAYALMLISLGIAWKEKHLRIAAIVLLGVTIVKLFLYDAAGLDTIPRTILFVSIGITLLVISFLYNKYKASIFGLTEE